MVDKDMRRGGHQFNPSIGFVGCVYVYKASAVSPTVSDTIIMVE